MCCVLQEAAVCVVSCGEAAVCVVSCRRLLCVLCPAGGCCVCVFLREAAVCVVSCPIYRRLLCVLCPALYTGGCCVVLCPAL